MVLSRCYAKVCKIDRSDVILQREQQHNLVVVLLAALNLPYARSLYSRPGC